MGPGHEFRVKTRSTEKSEEKQQKSHKSIPKGTLPCSQRSFKWSVCMNSWISKSERAWQKKKGGWWFRNSCCRYPLETIMQSALQGLHLGLYYLEPFILSKEFPNCKWRNVWGIFLTLHVPQGYILFFNNPFWECRGKYSESIKIFFFKKNVWDVSA